MIYRRYFLYVIWDIDSGLMEQCLLGRQHLMGLHVDIVAMKKAGGIWRVVSCSPLRQRHSQGGIEIPREEAAMILFEAHS